MFTLALAGSTVIVPLPAQSELPKKLPVRVTVAMLSNVLLPLWKSALAVMVVSSVPSAHAPVEIANSATSVNVSFFKFLIIFMF